ncbi:hypothetical protein WG66_014011, partial [Moniliophthora roreri]
RLVSISSPFQRLSDLVIVRHRIYTQSVHYSGHFDNLFNMPLSFTPLACNPKSVVQRMVLSFGGTWSRFLLIVEGV